MAIDPKININENQVIFRGNTGHRHDGLTSTLIDYTKYSMFDFVVYPIASPGTTRRNFQENNLATFKSVVVAAVEERVLNPAGIRLRANTITANEIAANTITANELSANIVLVNNIIQSNNYATGSTGWAIDGAGTAEFSNVTVRGTVVANGGAIGDILVNSTAIYSSVFNSTSGFKIHSNGFADFNDIAIRGVIEATSGNIGGILSDSSNFYTSNYDGTNPNYNGTQGFILMSNGYANFTNVKIGNNASIGTSATIGGSLTIGNNIRVNGATADGGATVFKVRGDTNTSANFVAKFQKLNGDDVLNIRNDGAVTIAGSLAVNGSTVVTGGPYLPTAGGTVTGALTVNGNVIINDDVLIKSDSANTATTVMLASTNDQDERVLSTRANGYISAAYLPSGTGTAIVRSSGFLFLETSTIKIKENIEYVDESVLDFVKKLKPVKYTYKRNESDTDYTYSLKQLNKEIGFIVEDIESVQPEIGVSLINYDSAENGKFDDRLDSPPFSSDDDFIDIEPKMYKPNSILSIAIKAIQELAEKNQEFEARLQAIEGV